MTDDTLIAVEVADPSGWLPHAPYLYVGHTYSAAEALAMAVARDASLSNAAAGTACVVASYIADAHRHITVAMIGERCTDTSDVIAACLRELDGHGYVTLMAGAG
jgi:hypothetical protein